ncbi:MAG: methyltransferase domain-containing protein [Candidatus Eremiobacteraeota bacterium]|nr:methyltransferase domain-containing protein [Candidatus Eremiobacteraeota bacterium]MCW5867067.1 methyltransferase domain-containing protein [Candidatus Eremiobacteraeota bacterium]
MQYARELLGSGRLAELRELIQQSPPEQAAHLQAALRLAEGEPQLALEMARRAVALDPQTSTRNTLALCLLACRQAAEAEAILQDLVQAQPDNPDLWFNLARCQPDGLPACLKALALRPDWTEARLWALPRLPVAQALALARQNPTSSQVRLWEARLVLADGRPLAAAQLCLALLPEEPEAAGDLLLEALHEAGQVPADERILAVLRARLQQPGVWQLAEAALANWPEAEDLLLVVLTEGQVTSLALEDRLTEWRRNYRENPIVHPLADALAAHNFTYGFAFAEQPGEAPPVDHPAYALYRPLPPGLPAGPLTAQRHWHEPARRRELLASLRPLAGADAVMGQYEQNPYPCWRSLGVPGRPSQDERDVLVAGCGTGQHAFQVARCHPRATVWALDFSLPSLAYAMQAQERLGIGNVRFLAADLLRLEETELPDSFASIECMGVLHHLEDPLAGLRALRARLAPHGWLRLGLYSRRGRAPMQRARQLARAYGPLDLRTIRQNLRRDLTPEELGWLAGIREFYSLSGLRDLLLHERQIELDLPTIQRWLEATELRFDRFDPAPWLAQPPTDLAGWDDYEARFPDAFRSMYMFWCQASPA